MAVSVSLRSLILGLVVVCVVVVGLLCTALSVSSGNIALEDTKDSRDESVNRAFATGADNALMLADDYLELLGDTTVRELGRFWGVSRDIITTVCQSMVADKKVAKSWEFLYSLRVQFYHLSKSFEEIDGVGLITEKHQVLQVVENTETLDRPADQYHHFHVNINNGTDYDMAGGIPAKERTLQAEFVPDGTGTVYGYPHNMSNVNRICHGESALASDGEVLDAPCRYPLGYVRNVHAHFYNKSSPMSVYYTPLTSLGMHVGALAQCDYGNTDTGELYGLVVAGVDLRKVSVFLRALNLGKKGSQGRAFVVVREDTWSTGPGQFGYLAGTSHGTSFEEAQSGLFSTPYKAPMHAVNCSDALVSGTALYLEEEVDGLTRYEKVYREKHPHPFNLSTASGSAGEQFYVSVKVYDNGLGLNWYVVSLIDREYLLGEVDRVTEETRTAVQESEAKVNRNLKEARDVLIIVVCVSALVPIALAVVLVFRITMPLMRLVTDMARVAVMDLESVEASRPSSIVSEVHQMETSFEVMLHNLVEYRQYLPQSLLVDTEDDEDKAEPQKAGGSGKFGRGCAVELPAVPVVVASDAPSRKGSGGASSDTPQVVASAVVHRAHVFDSSLAAKNITLMVHNVAGFNRTPDAAIPEFLQAYLDPFVAHAKQFRGVIDDLSGDRVTVSFNTAITSASHRPNSVEFALLLKDLLKDRVKANASITTGSAVCGNMGCTGLKKYGVVGNVASNARAVERSGRAWGIDILCDGAVARDSQHRFVFRKLVRALLKDGHDTLLHEAVNTKAAGNNEWMYQLAETEAADPFREANDAVLSLYKGDTDTAQKCLTNCGSPGTGLAKCLLEWSLVTGSAPLPVDLFYAVPMLPDQSTHTSQPQASPTPDLKEGSQSHSQPGAVE